MPSAPRPGGTFTLKDTPFTVNRMGFGAMQLTGPMAWGEPRDRKGAIATLREAISSASITWTPATTMARTSPTRSSGRRCIRTPKAW